MSVWGSNVASPKVYEGNSCNNFLDIKNEGKFDSSTQKEFADLKKLENKVKMEKLIKRRNRKMTKKIYMRETDGEI
jgi:hypothetical protein